MSNDSFEFKKFIIYQDACAMKIGTDSVILGAWCKFDGKKNCKILDIGTGTGILAIMAAQKNPEAIIKAVEINEKAALQAKQNVGLTVWKNNIEVITGNISDFKYEFPFDYIISNPPYFENSLKSPDNQRSVARHTDSLSFAELTKSISRLLANDGKSFIIIPSEAEDSLCSATIDCGLYPAHKVNIITREGQKPKRIILVMMHKPTAYSEESITIRNTNGNYTEQYIELTKDFYKKL